MKKHISLCKIITCHIVLLTASCRCNIINLHLNAKPRSVNLYKWCKKQAKNLVNAKKNKLLQMLNVNSTEWQETKQAFETSYAQSVNITRNSVNQAIPLFIRRGILSILANPIVRKKFNITNILKTEKEIKAVTANGKNIRFITTDKNLIRTCHRTIVINPNSMRSYISYGKETEFAIGHELGHMLREHGLEASCMIKIYNQKAFNFERIPSKDQFMQALNEYRRAQEIEADIIGIFNDFNLIWAGHTFFGWCSENPSSNKIDYHPSDQQRVQYFQQIKTYLEQSEKTAESYQNQQPQNRRNSRQPISTPKLTPQPVRITQERPETQRQKMQQIAVTAAKRKIIQSLSQKRRQITTITPKRIVAQHQPRQQRTPKKRKIIQTRKNISSGLQQRIMQLQKAFAVTNQRNRIQYKPLAY